MPSTADDNNACISESKTLSMLCMLQASAPPFMMLHMWVPRTGGIIPCRSSVSTFCNKNSATGHGRSALDILGLKYEKLVRVASGNALWGSARSSAAAYSEHASEEWNSAPVAEAGGSGSPLSSAEVLARMSSDTGGTLTALLAQSCCSSNKRALCCRAKSSASHPHASHTCARRLSSVVCSAW